MILSAKNRPYNHQGATRKGKILAKKSSYCIKKKNLVIWRRVYVGHIFTTIVALFLHVCVCGIVFSVLGTLWLVCSNHMAKYPVFQIYWHLNAVAWQGS